MRVSLLIVAIVLFLEPWAIRLGDHYAFSQCQNNQRNLATSCEMYRSDHGDYPDRLQDLIPTYLPAIPPCPAAGTKGQSYSHHEDRFEVSCDCPSHRRLGRRPGWYP